MQSPINAWQIIRPFWFSDQKKIAWGLLCLSIFLDLSNVYVVVKFTYWQKDLFDALAGYDALAIKPLMVSFFVLACVGLFSGVFSIYFKQLLEIKWRSWLTTDYLESWLAKQHFFQMEYQQLADNPDQRIAEDLALLAQKSIELCTGFLKNAVNLVSYSIVIWGLSSAWRFNLWGTELAIPGIMLWLAIIYAVLGSWAIEKIGHPLVNINYIQQRNEANFRYLLVRIRENAEQIALSKGERNEKARLFASFAAIKENWRKIMLYTKRITFTEELYVEVGAYLPYLLMLPQYFAKRMSIGDVMQTTIAFGRLRMALSWFVFQYKELAELRAILNRLCEFQSALQLQQQASIHIQTHPSNQLQLLGLELKQPDGKLLSKLQDVCFSSGDHWLIQGASGSGKTTLFRAIAGLWPHGQGQILIPEHKQIMYMPQKSYLPIGPLKDALCYPLESSNFSDQVCRDLLQQVRLQHLSDQLKQSNDWEKLLSPGEQQRLAFARVLLQKPDYVFLDEVTSALDLDNEQHLYQLLLEQLPNTTIISIAHHPSLRQFHQHHLDIRS